jgi:putative colanic acid biosysnthesis UDP-glucose lipid carrier transferase
MNRFSIRQQNSTFGVVQRISDVSLICLTMYASQWIANQPININTPMAVLAAALAFLLCGEVIGIYRSDSSQSPNQEVLAILGTWTVSLLLLSGLAFFTRTGAEFARSSTIGWIVLGTASIALMRMLLRIITSSLMHAGWATRRCAIVGLNPLGLQLQENLDNDPGSGLQLIGFFDDRHQQRDAQIAVDKSIAMGSLNELVSKAKAGQVETVFVTLPMRAENRIRWILDQLADTTASVYIVPDFFVFELLHSRWNAIGGLPVVSVFETPLYGVDGWVKRAFDFSVALAGLIAISPIMLICAVLVRMSSAGPIFFRQRRYGLDGREIWVWKFRSMRVCDNGSVVRQATKLDPRITPIGAILRRTSLDELPQLFNVIEGTMSLVGPRPHASAHNEHYRKLIRGYMLRHKVKPGITGLAQVEGFRGETETLDKMQKRIDFDHRYIREWSIWLDIKILIRTFRVVFQQQNAY